MFSVCLVITAALVAQPGPAILQRVPQLQETAYASGRGNLGCGIGMMTLVTSRGTVTFETGLDPIYVFGRQADAADLIALLQARADSNRTRTPGPMSGDVSALCYVCLSALADAREWAAIPVAAELLTDKDKSIRRSAKFAFDQLTKTDEEVRNEKREQEDGTPGGIVRRKLQSLALPSGLLLAVVGLTLVVLRRAGRIGAHRKVLPLRPSL